MIEDVEKLNAELPAFGLVIRNVLERGELPLLQSWPRHDVAALVAEKSG